jgi:hypothetical protein
VREGNLLRMSLRRNRSLSCSPSLISSLIRQSEMNEGNQLRGVHTFINESKGIPGREEQISKLKEAQEFDILVIGGGATGAGIWSSHLSLLLSSHFRSRIGCSISWSKCCLR